MRKEKRGAPGRAALPERPEPEEPDRHRHPRAALTAPGMHRAAPPAPPAPRRAATPRPLAGRGRKGAQEARSCVNAQRPALNGPHFGGGWAAAAGVPARERAPA